MDTEQGIRQNRDGVAPPVEAVCWDIGGVLLDLSTVPETQRRFVTWLCEQYDLDVDPETALDTWREATGAYFARRTGTEYLPARDAYRTGVEAVTGESLPTEEWLPRFRACQHELLTPTDGALDVVETIADGPRHQGIISDIDTAEAELMLETFELTDAFDAVTTSEAVGTTKPDPRMFETAIEAGDLDPDRTLYVGDRYEHDMVGGSDAGFRTVAFGVEQTGPAIDHRIDDLRQLLGLLE
jgi:putative hydrolase of the HAD superfamily